MTKIVYKDKRKFNLDEEHFNIILDYVKNKNKDCLFELTKSPSVGSNSFYITIFYKGIKGHFRISDHDTYMTAMGAKLKSFIVGNRTQIRNICNLVQERIQSLKYKYKITKINTLYNKIERKENV